MILIKFNWVTFWGIFIPKTLMHKQVQNIQWHQIKPVEFLLLEGWFFVWNQLFRLKRTPKSGSRSSYIPFLFINPFKNVMLYLLAPVCLWYAGRGKNSPARTQGLEWGVRFLEKWTTALGGPFGIFLGPFGTKWVVLLNPSNPPCEQAWQPTFPIIK